MGSIRSDDIRGRWGRLIDNLASFIGIEVSGTISGLNLNVASGIVVPVISGNTISLTSGLIANQISGVNISIQSGLIVPVISGSTISLTSGLIANQISGSSINIQSGLVVPIISGTSLNIQSGIIGGAITVSGLTTFNGSINIGAGASGINFSGLQMLPTMGPKQVNIWVSGTTYRAVDNGTGQIFSSGTNATTVIQAAWDHVAGGAAGGTVAVLRGLYLLPTSVVISGSIVTSLEGEGHSRSQLRSISGDAIITFAPGADSITLNRLWLTHNNLAQSGGLLVFQGGNDLIRVQNTDFYDFDNRVGNAIQIQNQSGNIQRLWFENCFVQGFSGAIRPESQAGATYFMTDIVFDKIYANGTRYLMALKCDTSGTFNGMSFNNCRYQWASGAANMFDYETENSGLIQFQTHTNCIGWDLTSGAQYALVTSGMELECHGCLPTYRMSGAGMTAVPRRVRRWDVRCRAEGIFKGSGNASNTTYTFPHGLGGVIGKGAAVNPISIIAVPASLQAGSGTTIITSGNASSIIVTFTAAPTSGDCFIHWTVQA